MKFLYYCYLFFSFFPFIKIINLGTDLQPYAFLTSIIIIVVSRYRRIPIKIIPMIFVIISSIIILATTPNIGFDQIRSFYNYISLMIITYAGYIIFSKYMLEEKHLKIIINLWFVVSFVQKFIYSNFLLFAVSGGRTSIGRGVVSLTSEPSFYGYMLIFALFFVLDFKKDKWFYILNLAIQLFFFSQSAIAILYITIYILLVSFRYAISLNPKLILQMISILLLIMILMMIYANIYPNSRATLLLTSIISDPESVLATDESVNARYSHIQKSLEAAWNNKFIPYGFDKSYWLLGKNRIMSGYGAAIFELGIFGVILVINNFIIVATAISHQNKFVHAIFLTIIMFSAIQVGLPTLGLYLGYLLNKSVPLYEPKGN